MTNRELTMKLFRVQGLLMRGGPHGGHSHGCAHRGQGRVLSLLRLKPETSQRELSYVLDMRQQSLSELLGKLESKGYITRTPSPEDKRVTLISLTEAGRAAAPDPEAQEEDGPFACLTEEERQQLGEYLDRVAQALEEQLGEEPRGFDERPWPPMPPFGGPCGHHGHHGSNDNSQEGPCGHRGPQGCGFDERPWPPMPPFGGPCGHHGHHGPDRGGQEGPCGHHGHGPCGHSHGNEAPCAPDAEDER